MRIQDFLKLIGQTGRTNYAALCPDELGLGLLLQGALSAIAVSEDVHFFDAEGVTVEKARQIEIEARRAPLGGSKLQHFFIYSLHKLPPYSAGPLLKAVEEAGFARFIFQAQDEPRKIRTLLSRTSVVRLPFLSRKTVLANLKAMNYDARTADQLNLYDGTLGGTIKALSMKDALVGIQRETKRGLRGLASLFSKDTLASLAFDPAIYGILDPDERFFIQRGREGEAFSRVARQKIALYRALARQPNE